MKTLCHVSQSALINNFTVFQALMGHAQVIPVVKANAYGHGAVAVTRILRDQFNCKMVAVATLEEAQELGQFFPDLDVLIFTRIFPSELAQLPSNAIISVTGWDDFLTLKSCASRALRLHININTGMNRLGMRPERVLEAIKNPNRYLQIEGVYSHFSSSDTADQTVMRKQKESFQQVCSALDDIGFSGLKHLSNSAGILNDPELACDAMRLGISLYGYDTTPGQRFYEKLSPVMTVLAPLVRVSSISTGESVSYGETWTASTKTRVGTLRIGYADGYRRSLSNRGIVEFENRSFPVIGTVTMDHIMVDLKDAEIPTGEYFAVLGGGENTNAIARVAKQLGTIPYEICCGISPRVERVIIAE